MSMVPLAALSLESVKERFRGLSVTDFKKQWRRFTDTANYSEVLPPIGSQQLSYAKFLEMLSHRLVKRIYLLDNGTCAIVEVHISAELHTGMAA